MPAETERVLALGGEVHHAPLGKHETDFYLQRVSIFTCSLAVSVALLVSLVAPLFEKPTRTPEPRIPYDHRVIPTPMPPSIVPSPPMPNPGKVVVRAQEFNLPKPVADDEVWDQPYEWDVTGGGKNGDPGRLTEFDGHWPGIDEGFIRPRNAKPEVFLFVEVPPVLVSMETPVYPDLAREAGVEGVVLVKVLVSEEGFVLDTLVLEGAPMLSEAAVVAAQTAVFKPAQQSNQPVRTWVVVPIEFTLR